jgi:hypothetical protein
MGIDLLLIVRAAAISGKGPIAIQLPILTSRMCGPPISIIGTCPTQAESANQAHGKRLLGGKSMRQDRCHWRSESDEGQVKSGPRYFRFQV